MIDEGPSSEDLDRFGGDTAFCPSCGEEIWDAAEVCPNCGNHVGGNALSRHPVEAWWRTKWSVLIVIAIILGLVGWLWMGFL